MQIAAQDLRLNKDTLKINSLTNGYKISEECRKQIQWQGVGME